MNVHKNAISGNGVVLSRRVDRRTDTQAERQTDRQTDWQTDGRTYRNCEVNSRLSKFW